jgi:hypothetical protein
MPSDRVKKAAGKKLPKAAKTKKPEDGAGAPVRGPARRKSATDYAST